MSMPDGSPLETAAAAVIGRPVWLSWKGYGSFVAFECGEARPTVSDEPFTDDRLFGAPVTRRIAGVAGSHCLMIEMAAWKFFAGSVRLAHSQSDREEIDSVVHWITGQHLQKLVRRGPCAVELQFDLGARFEIAPARDAHDADSLLSIRHETTFTTLHADGSVTVQPWVGGDLDASVRCA